MDAQSAARAMHIRQTDLLHTVVHVCGRVASADWVADERSGSAHRSSSRSCLVSALDTRVCVEAVPKLGCCIRFYRGALRPDQFDVRTRTSASRP